ncbi:MAG: ribonuclease H-like domain-containing protein [Eubacterium sp.]|nr:ribonuclease H-like domain-containing protein [Eubacterium sp.]
MEHIRQALSYNSEMLHTAASLLPCPAENACFFDIETTGLSPRVSSLYLIGAATFENGQWWIDQWFADDYTSEEEILRSFSDFSSSVDTFVHYNGSTFDIPYLEKKYQASHLPSPFTGKTSLDLYRQIKPLKKQFPTRDQKLTTMERFVGFHRHDTYSGKDCIRLYTEFMHKKYFHDPESDTRKKNLLLHNHDDLVGTTVCTLLLAYRKYTPNQPCLIQKENAVCFSDFLPQPVPVPLSYEKNQILFSYEGNRIEVTVPLQEGTYYHFFADYKNYYYLPKEDMAVHKSVGTYVEPAFREKATAANCYIKKTGTFLPLPKGIDWSAPVFRTDKKSHSLFIPWTKDASLSEEEVALLISGFMHMPL